jgi:CheY-like chemotaxis protein
MSGQNSQSLPVRAHILVVEDDQAFGETLRRLLSREGYAVSVAADFHVALKVLEGDEPVELLLTDVVMPDSVNGVALSRMARLRRRDLKVLYMTGYDIPGIDREALGPILRKPVDDKTLLDEVARLLGTSSP